MLHAKKNCRFVRGQLLERLACTFVFPIRYPSGDYRCSIHGARVFLFITRCFSFYFFSPRLPTLSSSRNIRSVVTTTRIRNVAIFLVVRNMTSRFYMRRDIIRRQRNWRERIYWADEILRKPHCNITRYLFINWTVRDFFFLIYLKEF